jgi:drug/metabolite transporter (DMT)-like permease
MRLIATSFAGVYTVFNKQNFELILNILLIAVAAVGYTLTYMLKLKITQYLWIIGIGYAFIYVLMIAGYVYICKKFDKSITPVSNVSD